jgi:hypothetical protein
MLKKVVEPSLVHQGTLLLKNIQDVYRTGDTLVCVGVAGASPTVGSTLLQVKTRANPQPFVLEDYKGSRVSFKGKLLDYTSDKNGLRVEITEVQGFPAEEIPDEVSMTPAPDPTKASQPSTNPGLSVEWNNIITSKRKRDKVLVQAMAALAGTPEYSGKAPEVIFEVLSKL